MDIMFKPWQGKNYGSGKYGRLLLVGESHYESPAIKDRELFTEQMVGSLKQQVGNPFYDSISDVFTPEERHVIWDEVAFVNAIQHVFANASEKPQQSHWNTCEKAMQEYLKLTKPEKMIIFSIGVWTKGLPPRISWGAPIAELKDPIFNRRSNVFRFEYDGGFCHGIGVHHPSSRMPRFQANEWRPLISSFLAIKYD